VPLTPTRVRVAVAVTVAALLAVPVWGRQADPRAAIEAATKKFAEAGKKGDAKLAASVYTPDAEAFPPNGELVKGREAIQKMWEGVFASGVSGIDLKAREVQSAGDWAWEWGGYTMQGKDGKDSRPRQVLRRVEARAAAVAASPRHLELETAGGEVASSVRLQPDLK
jgi:uncharacterized protein (TIGR02246 family)